MIKAVLFDAYGTLLDVDAAAAQLASSGKFPELQSCWPELASIWRTRQLNYTWLRSLSGSYKPFWEITSDALDYAMEALSLSNAEMRDALLKLYRELAAYEDAVMALDAVATKGFRNGGSVWGFIVNTDNDKKFRKGDILKAAGYNAPARNAARGNILDGGYCIQWTGPLYLV